MTIRQAVQAGNNNDNKNEEHWHDTKRQEHE